MGSANGRASVLSVHNGAGVTKRKGKGKALSRHQRLRQEKGIQRAEVVMDKTEKRVEKNNVKVKTVKERSVGCASQLVVLWLMRLGCLGRAQ